MAHPRLSWLCLPLLGIAGQATAIEVCDLPARYGLSQAAIAIVRTACNEHRLWQRPFIDTHGRVASLSTTEAESENLADHGLVAWQRVARYWRDSGTLAAMDQIEGARSCQTLDGNRYSASDCRAFLLDNPWSAAFVSWVMTQAGLTTFSRSPRHIDYIRAAYHDADASPYLFTDPASDKPAPGDLLCMLRDRDDTVGYAGLRTALGNGGTAHWKSHCDIVIAANVGGDRTLYLIGGNVLNTVMMRKLPLDRNGKIALPEPSHSSDSTPDSAHARYCSPAQEEICDFNHGDWAALLKLRPQAVVSNMPANVLPAINTTADTPAAVALPQPDNRNPAQ